MIALIALVIVGPEQLPSVLRKLGKQAAQLRSMTESIRDEFMSGVDEVNPVNWMEDTSDVPKNPTSREELEGRMDKAEILAEEEAMGKKAAAEQQAKFESKAEETMERRRSDPSRAGQRAEAAMGAEPATEGPDTSPAAKGPDTSSVEGTNDAAVPVDSVSDLAAKEVVDDRVEPGEAS